MRSLPKFCICESVGHESSKNKFAKNPSIFSPFPSSFSSSGSLRVGKFPMLPGWLSGKESACQCRRCGFDPWVGKIPWRMSWQPSPAFLSGKSHGQRSLVGYSPWGLKRVGHDLVTKQQQFFNIRQHEDIY